ncbi:MAG: protein-export chaperone SecB [Pseudomonadota bacterium]
MNKGDVMSDTPTPPAPGVGDAAPSLRVLAQYLKDLSFENPRAPQVFTTMTAAPNIAVNVDVNARGVGEDQYEVELTVSAKATHNEEAVFVIESAYAGAFEIKNVPAEQLEIVLLVECPRIIFPFLRQILAETTQTGNFPPVMLDPIDFLAIYEQRRRAAAASPAPEGAQA